MGFKLEKLVENKVKQESREKKAKQVILAISHVGHSL